VDDALTVILESLEDIAGSESADAGMKEIRRSNK
jgi:hypothetical protein